MSTNVGQQLRQAREASSITLEQAAQVTRLRIHYIKALEEDNFEALPSIAQGRGFLRLYAGFLNLDANSLLAQLDSEALGAPETSRVDEKTIPAPEMNPKEAAPEAPTNLEQAEAIFVEIGQDLRQRRELLGLTQEEVEKNIHLKKFFLQALESGNMAEMPSPVQGRGMLKNYAAYLGLETDKVLLRFAEGLQSRFLARAEVSRQEATPPQQIRTTATRRGIFWRIFSTDFLVSGALVLFLVVFILWAVVRILEARPSLTATPFAPSIAEVLLASPTASATSLLELASPTHPLATLALPTLASGEIAPAEGTVQPINQESVRVTITVRQRTWMRVLVDGKVEFDGRVIPGSAYPFVGEEQVEVQTGNGAALQVIYNQQDLGTLGAFGQVVLRIFSRQGIIAPTVTITLTPTATLPPTATPPPTRTSKVIQPTAPVIP